MTPEATTELVIFVPAAEDSLSIMPGSAIVGFLGATSTMIYFEGNKYNAVNLATFEDRLDIAAGRLIGSYPTVARARIENQFLRPVGKARMVYGTKAWFVSEIGDQAALQAWIGTEPLPTVGGSKELRQRYAARAYQNLPHATLVRLTHKAQQEKRDLSDVIFESIYRV